MKEETKAKLKQVLEQAVARGELAGGSLLVRQAGEEVCYLEAGMADKEQGRPINRSDIYRLYSMTKPITGAAAMKLFEDGLLDLGEAVSTYLPAARNQTAEEKGRAVPVFQEMKVKNLLDMTSGLIYIGEAGIAGGYSDQAFRKLGERLLTEQPMTTREFADELLKGPLAFHPGSSWRYGTSADVLGAVIEAASGERFGDYLEKNFFVPLEMKDTGFYVPEEKRGRLVTVYREEESQAGEGKAGVRKLVPYRENHLGILNAMDQKPAFESGGAGLASTIDDYANFAQMLLNGGVFHGKRILKPETVSYMTAGALNKRQEKALWANFPNLLGYSYGNLMRIMKEPGKAYWMNHVGDYGWDGWLGCYFSNDPYTKRTTLLMMQKTDTGLSSLARRMQNIITADEEGDACD